MRRASASAPQRAGGNLAPLEPRCTKGLMSISRPHAATVVAGNDAPLIAERAATRGRIATEGGDERGGV
jgi:hypothetical protein